MENEGLGEYILVEEVLPMLPVHRDLIQTSLCIVTLRTKRWYHSEKKGGGWEVKGWVNNESVSPSRKQMAEMGKWAKL